VRHGGPSAQTAAWQGRWWSQGGAFDLLPLGDRVLVASPGLLNPVQDASEISVLGAAQAGRVPGRITQAGGYASHGELAHLVLDASGQPKALKLGGTLYKPEAEMAAEMQQRYGTRAGQPG
jgi:hypothetical protein